MLSSSERNEALSISLDTLLFQVQKEVDCVGCCNQLSSYIQESFHRTPLYGLDLYPPTGFGLSVCSSSEDVARLLAELKLNSGVLQEFNRELNIKRKEKANVFSKSKIHRCLLHSKKPISNKNLYSILETNGAEFQEYVQIDECVFLKNLNVVLTNFFNLFSLLDLFQKTEILQYMPREHFIRL